MGERQGLSIPREILSLEYYYFVSRRGVSIGLQGIHRHLPQLFSTFWKINMGYEHISLHPVLFSLHGHDHGHDHNLYLRILFCAHSHIYHGLRYLTVKSKIAGWLYRRVDELSIEVSHNMMTRSYSRYQKSVDFPVDCSTPFLPW